MDEYVQVMSQSATQEALIMSVVSGVVIASIMAAFIYGLKGTKSALIAFISIFLVWAVSLFFIASYGELREIEKEVELHEKYEQVMQELPEDTQRLARLVGSEYCLLKMDQRLDRKNCEKFLIEVADANMKE